MYIYWILFVLSFIVSIFFLGRHVKRFNFKKDIKYLSHLKVIDEFNQKINDFKTLYFDRNKEDELINKYHETYIYFSRSIRNFLNDNIIDEFSSTYNSLHTLVPEWNKAYVQKELEETKEYFSNIDGKSLDEQQRRAVIVDEISNLVLAGAGSGKTLTIAAKVKYLVEKKGVSPESILLLSYTRKAAEEMSDRINKKLHINIEAYTFHKLGLWIITKSNKKRPDIDESLLRKVIITYFDVTILQNKKQVQNLLIYYGQYFSIPKDLEEFECLGDYYEFQKSMNFETLKGKLDKENEVLESKKKSHSKYTIKGEIVKSLEEAMIANFLFLHGVRYEYERAYPFESNDPYRKTYRPDFYLVDYDIYLEHFGITIDNRTPWLLPPEDQKYLEGIKWKRSFHKENNTKLIETYSYFNKDGSLLAKLEKLLLDNQVVFQEIDYEAYYKKVFAELKEQYFEEFINLLATFISLFKSNGHKEQYLNDLKTKCEQFKTLFEKERAKLFLEILKPIYQLYAQEQRETRTIDFHDMINDATELLRNSDIILPYKYIIVDEYQDISQNRFNLIKSIRDRSYCKILCVGDDWQSIYRFAGSDISLFTNFEKKLGFSEILKIEKTYRNSSQLIEVAEKFISANPMQLKKQLKSEKQRNVPIVLMGYHAKKEEALINAIKKIVQEFGNSAEIALLGRTKYDLTYTLNKENSKPIWEYEYNDKEGRTIVNCILYPHLNIWFSTVHKSKGLEAENVIILNMENKLMGFPNQIADDPLLSLLLIDSDTCMYAEERRLFYVAITRTKHSTYLLVPDTNPSIFIQELITSDNVVTFFNPDEVSIQNNPTCPVCKKGFLVTRETLPDKRKFLGCSNYPRCQNTINDISILDTPIKCSKCGGYMVKRRGSIGDFLGCSNYPFCHNTLDR